MKHVKIVYEFEPVGIGSTILRGLHRLYYKEPEEILYFHFTNILYGDKNKNIWSTYLLQPFVSEKEFIQKEFDNKSTIEERGVFLNKSNRFLFCYGKQQDYGKEFSDPESVTKYRAAVTQYLNFKDTILNKVDDFCVSNFNGKRVVSLHKRGTDQFTSRGHAGPMQQLDDSRLSSIVEDYLKNYDAVFLATDEHKVYELLRQRFGNKIISYSTMRSAEGDNRGTHFGHINDTAKNKFLLGEEAIIDFLLMSRCSYSLCMKSNLSLLNILIRSDFNYHFIDDHIQYDKLG